MPEYKALIVRIERMAREPVAAPATYSGGL